MHSSAHARILAVALTLFLPVAMTVVTTQAADDNLVRNGGFEDAFRPSGKSNGQARISGELPKSWNDDSGWNDVIGQYSKIGDSATGDLVVDGQQALRMQHLGSRSERFTRLQLSQTIHLEKGKTYRLAASLRSPHSPLEGGHRHGLELAVRQGSSPYTAYATLSPNLTVDWREYDTTFIVPETDSYRLIALLHEKATADLDALSLTAIETPRDNGPHSTHNLLSNGRFPTGPGGPFTWSFDEQINRATRDSGPLGESALCLTGQFYLKTPPIRITPGRPHTFSVYLKSSTPRLPVQVFLSSTIRTGNEPLVSKTWQVGTTWERHTFTTDIPPVPHNTIYINLRSPRAKTISLDGLRLEEGPDARDYNTEARAEISIGLPPATLNQGIYLENETAILPLGVTGRWDAAAEVRLTVTDVFGQTASLPSLPLPSPDATSAENIHRDHIEVPPHAVNPARPLGSFRVTARVVNATGEPLGPPSEMTFMRVPAPLDPEKINPISPAGIHVRITDSGLTMARNLGFKWVRNHDMKPGLEITKWSYVEPTRGQFIWQDAMLEKITRHGLLLLGIIDTTPPWANRRPPDAKLKEEDSQRRAYAPRDLDDYKTFLTQLARHYHGRIHAYEVWNEPYSSSFFRDYRDGRTVHATPADLAAIHKAALEALTAVDPSITLVGVTSSGRINTYIQNAFAAGIYPHYKILGYHSYSRYGDPFDQVGNPTKLLAEEVKYGGGRTPLWNTEGSPMPRVTFFDAVNPIPDATHTDWAIKGTPLDLAADYPRYVLSNLAHGAQKIFIYALYVRPAMVEERGFKLLEPTGVPIPGIGAVAALNKLLNTGARLVKTITPAANINALIFEGGDLTFAAILTADGAPSTWRLRRLPDGTRLLDLFGNPLSEPPAAGNAPHYIVLDGNRANELLDTLR
ncbi:carbohydrate binding domain-containing protein [Geminisphaera colitermitum]|uniref:carbohydrate binding domain-containing protein n=1 Tax=Geminisphaera colitermitum TaxID=1148786 RepID=UPI0001965571|nr:carbohydrate binding domain-containing protein [Geminisphaera colitermitum]